MKQLTDKQNEILHYIKWFISAHGFSPSIRDIADDYNMSTNGAYCHIKALENKGKIVRNKNGAARSIILPDDTSYKPDIETLNKNKKYSIIKHKMRPLPKGKRCVICNTTENIQRHHEDYSKSDDIIELCRNHHRELHIIKRILNKKGYAFTIFKC